MAGVEDPTVTGLSPDDDDLVESLSHVVLGEPVSERAPYLSDDDDDYDVISSMGVNDAIRILSSDTFVSNMQMKSPELIEVLSYPSMMRILLELTLQPAPEDVPEDDVQRRKKIPHVAFQTLASEPLAEPFMSHEELRDVLVDFLINHPFEPYMTAHMVTNPLIEEPPRTGYCAKLCESLCERYPTEMVAYFRRKIRLVPAIVRHVGDPYVMEWLFKLVDYGITHQWLLEAQLLHSLVCLLEPDAMPQQLENASHVMVNVLALCHPWTQSQLVIEMFAHRFMTDHLLSFVVSEPTSGPKIKQGLGVLIAKLNLLTEPPYVIHGTLEKVPFLLSIVTDPTILGDSGEMNGPSTTTFTFGKVPYIFGSVRLRVVELLVSLLYTGYAIVVEVYLREKVFSSLVRMLQRFPWNNILHYQIVQMFAGLVCSGNERLVSQTVLESGIFEHVIAIFEREDERSSIGYFGHLVQICHELVKASKFSDSINEMLRSTPQWVQLVRPYMDSLMEEEEETFEEAMCNVDDLGLYNVCSPSDFEFEDEYELIERDDDDDYDDYLLDSSGSTDESDFDYEDVEM